MSVYAVRPLTPEAQLRLKGIAKASHCPFTATWMQTERLLRSEVDWLRPRGDRFVMMLDVREHDVRQDGTMRSNARPPGSDVAITFTSVDKGELLFVCGRFWSWQENARAIALGLEALRKVERYGITQSNEQYRGWQALPPGMPMPAAKMTVEEAARFVSTHAGAPFVTIEATRHHLPHLYKHAARKLHPDVEGGDAELFKKLTEARDLLGAAA